MIVEKLTELHLRCVVHRSDICPIGSGVPLITMPKKKDNAKDRTVFDDFHYRTQALLRDKKFAAMISWLKGKFAEFGCPVPSKGFKTMQEYLDWNGRYWKTWSQRRYGPKYQIEVERLTDGTGKFSFEQYQKLLRFEADFLPPVYGDYFDEILDTFGIDKNIKEYQEFLEQHVFFNEQRYLHDLLKIVWQRPDPKTPLRLFIEILPQTKLEDIESQWGSVLKEQKLLPDFRERNSEWQNFERDLSIYQAYVDLKKKLAAQGRKRKSGVRLATSLKSGGSKPIEINRLDYEIFQKIQKKHPALTFDAIRTIISRTKQRLQTVTPKDPS